MAQTNGNRHESQGFSITRQFDRQISSKVFQGDQSQIQAYVEGLQVGDYNHKESITESPQLVTGVNMRRMNAEICEATVQTTKFLKRAVWGFDFHPLSKPTITFRYPGETDATVNLRAHRIRGWEALRDANRLPEYLDFRCIIYNSENEEIGTAKLDSTSTEGCGPNTLAIAQKLMRGQDTYTIYYPVITCTRTSDEPFTDDLDSVGKRFTPSIGAGWTTHGNPDQLKAVLALKAYWVETGDNIATNIDGSFTRRQVWTGMDDLDKDFYPLR